MASLATARHEAAHAVIAEAMGVRVKRVTVRKTDGMLGFCEYDLRQRTTPLRSAMITCAGIVAEKLWHRPRLVQSQPDSKKLDRLCRMLRDSRSDRELILELTGHAVRQRKRQIDRVAKALLKRKTLTGREVRELL